MEFRMHALSNKQETYLAEANGFPGLIMALKTPIQPGKSRSQGRAVSLVFRYWGCVLLLLLIPQVVSAERYALLIGRNDGGPGVNDLQYAESDAGGFAGILSTLAGIDPTRIKVLLRPDSAAIDHAFMKIDTAIHNSGHPEQDLLLVYYSGHADGLNILLGKQGYPLQRLQRQLTTSSAGMRIGIFDACRSGMVTSYKGGKRAEPFFWDRQPQAQGQIIIASSAATEMAQESSTLRASVFSHHFANGLRGSADFSGDGKVTVTEAYQYAYRKTVETTALTGGGLQHPVYKFNITGQSDFILTDLSQHNGGVLFDRSTDGGVYLILSDSYTDVVADFSKKKGQESFISLAPGPYIAIAVAENQTRTCNFTVSERTTRYLNSENFSLHPLELNRFKGPIADYHPVTTVTTSPLSTYSFGLGVGVLWSNAKSDRPWVTLSANNAWYINKSLSLFADGVWAGFSANGGADVGLDYTLVRQKPLVSIGAGLGLWYQDMSPKASLQNIGSSCTSRISVGIEVDKRSVLSLVAPIRYTSGVRSAFMAGIEMHWNWYGPYRDVEVLHY
jgi:hypothetical protein